MSLTSKLNTKIARKVLRSIVVNPGLYPKPKVRVPSISAFPYRIGTAFDYALRFGLRSRSLTEIDRVVAENAISNIDAYQSTEMTSLIQEEYTSAMNVMRSLPPSLDLDEDAARACLRLAALDVVCRARIVDEVSREPQQEEIDEMRDLYRIIPWERFKAATRIIANPTFGEGSSLVGGADADLIMDKTLVEIKTIKEQSLSIDIVRQLVGYAVLANTFGVNGKPFKVLPIEKLAVYFSRSGYLHTFELADAVTPAARSKVLEFLIDPGKE